MAKIINEKEMLASLSNAGLPKDSLQKYSKLLADLRKNNLLLEKWWVVGQPVPDVLHVAGRLNEENMVRVSDIFSMRGLGRGKVFPKGIINPEAFDLHLEFDARQF